MEGEKKRERERSCSIIDSNTKRFNYTMTCNRCDVITPITRHCHANNLPSTEQAVKTKPKQDVFLFH